MKSGTWFRFLRPAAAVATLCTGWLVCAHAQPSGDDKPWTATSQASSADHSPSRTTESHSKSGNRTVDKKVIEVLGADGRYQPYLETEQETIQVNATTTRTVVRSYGRDSNGQRNLTQVREEEAQKSASGDGKVVRTVSNPDLNGKLQVVQREVADTRTTGPDSQETKTTVYMPQGGAMTAVQQTQETQRRDNSGNVDVKKTTLLPDGSGKWQVGEAKESTIRQQGQTRASEERISRPDADGKLGEISRTVGKETVGADQQKTSSMEVYTLDSPGYTGDGKLHLNQRVKTVQQGSAGGRTTETQVEQPNPGAPDAGLRVTTKTIDIVRSGPSGTQSTSTIQVRDASGSFNVVSVDARQSTQAPAQPQPTVPPADKAKTAQKPAPEKAAPDKAK